MLNKKDISTIITKLSSLFNNLSLQYLVTIMNSIEEKVKKSPITNIKPLKYNNDGKNTAGKMTAVFIQTSSAGTKETDTRRIPLFVTEKEAVTKTAIQTDG